MLSPAIYKSLHLPMNHYTCGLFFGAPPCTWVWRS